MSCDTCMELQGVPCQIGNHYCMKFGCQNKISEDEKKERYDAAVKENTPSHIHSMMVRKAKNPLPKLNLGSYKSKTKLK